KDTTRIGKSNPRLWAEIFVANKEYLTAGCLRFERQLSYLRKMVEDNQRRKLTAYLEKLVRFRESLDENN
ncbi:MAG: prephenate dehydrogenase/arogenate dehydrogenase family protein, partial [Candidatus Omnitrophica bacterium]|nr:prephenate dehydrogenase/arogenate dehydrogenase family protein [Candidatus Omnitrophota bacterium]